MPRPPPTPEQRAQDAAIARELLAIADGVVTGAVSEEAARALADALPDLAKDAGHRGSVLARDLQRVLSDLGHPYRVSDVAGHAALVRRGEVTVPTGLLCTLMLPPAEIARRTGQPDVRFCVDGLGVHVFVEFGSLATGRAFVAFGPLEPPDGRTVTEVRTWRAPSEPESLADLLLDAFDTLGVDASDCWAPPDVPLRRWDLMRLDDNGNEFLVATYTGLAKANARIAELESHAHKQSYSLVPRPPGA